MNEEPVSEKDESGDLNELEKEEDWDQSKNLGAGIEEEIGSHDTRDGSACSYGGDFGVPVRVKMDNARCDSAEEVEDEIPAMTEPVLNIISENVEEPHIAEDVEKTAVEEHRGDEGEDLFEGCKLGGEARIGIPDGDNSIEEESLFQLGTQGKLPEEGDGIEDNDEKIDDWKSF